MTHRSGPDLDGLDDWTGPPLDRPFDGAAALRGFEAAGLRRPTLFGIPVVFDQTAPRDRILVVREDLCGDVPTGARYSSPRPSRPMGLQTADVHLAAQLQLVLALASEIGERSGEKVRRFVFLLALRDAVRELESI